MPKFHLGGLSITAAAFQHGGAIPDEYAFEGGNVSPELAWTGIPAGTVQLALVCHDPDAPLTYGFTHWVAYGLSPETNGLPKGGAEGLTEGTNDFGSTGYGGPAPPPGHGTHFYYFHLYALGAPLEAGPGLSGPDLLGRIDEHILEQARVVGTYSR